MNNVITQTEKLGLGIELEIAAYEYGLLREMLLHGNERTVSKEMIEGTVAEFILSCIEGVEFINSDIRKAFNSCIDLMMKKERISPAHPIFKENPEMAQIVDFAVKHDYTKSGRGKCDMLRNIVRMANFLDGNITDNLTAKERKILETEEALKSIKSVVKEMPFYGAMFVSKSNAELLLAVCADKISVQVISGVPDVRRVENPVSQATVYGLKFQDTGNPTNKPPYQYCAYLIQYEDYLWHLKDLVEVGDKIRQLEEADAELYVQWLQDGQPSLTHEPTF